MLKELCFKKRAPNIAKPEDLKKLEARLGITMPRALAEFCMRWNGGFAADANRFYAVPHTFEEFFAEYGHKDECIETPIMFGATEEFEQCDLDRKYSLLNRDMKVKVIPITADLLGNHAVLRADSPEGVVYWMDQDLWEIPENSPGPHVADTPLLIPIAHNLESFYNGLSASPI